MLRKTKKNAKVEYQKVYPEEDAESIISRLNSEYKTKINVYQKPVSYSGNQGVLELFPNVPSNLIIKLEGPMFILDEVFKLLC